MIEFLSLLLGLVTGPRDISLNAVGRVAEIEIVANGETLATLDAPPWTLTHDFGPDLRPYELVAIARDAEGRELDRAVQWLNLNQPNAEAKIAFLPGEDGRPAAIEVSWESIGRRQPEWIEVRFDGQRLPVEDPRRVPLPPYELGEFHYLSVTVHFSDNAQSQLEAGFGGPLGDELSTELTALAVRVKGRLPAARQMGAYFHAGGEPLRVHGVEKGTPQILVVRDPPAQDALDALAKTVARDHFDPNAGRIGRVTEWDPKRFFSTMTDDERRFQPEWEQLAGLRGLGLLRDQVELRFLSPVAAPIFPLGVRSEMFLRSPPLDAGGLGWHATRWRPQRFETHLADAVALAGMLVHAGNRPRAVLIVRADGAGDRGRFAVPAVRAYLRMLQVPLVVWTFGEGGDARWGDEVVLGTPARGGKTARRLETAVRDLRRTLGDQRIVWLEGRHLPQRIELSAEARERGLRLAGRE